MSHGPMFGTRVDGPLAGSGAATGRVVDGMGVSQDELAGRDQLSTVVSLEWGGAVAVTSVAPNRSRLRVTDPNGTALDVEIRFDVTGPVVHVRSSRLELDAADSVEIRCERFDVDARQGISLRSGGELVQKAVGDARLDARNVDLVAQPGAIRVKANDEVQMLGEMILLNCDRPKPLPEWTQRRVRALMAPIPPERNAGAADLIDLLAD